MNRKYFLRIILISSAICIFTLFGFSQESNDIWVTKLQAETSNHLLITIRVENTEVKVGESIPVWITVKNNNRNPIFFVKKENLEIQYKLGEIYIFTPNPFPEDKEEYDFSFHKIESGANYNGQILIPGKIISEESNLRISVGLGFVYDIIGLDRKLKSGEDPMRLRGLLGKRLETVRISELSLASVL